MSKGKGGARAACRTCAYIPSLLLAVLARHAFPRAQRARVDAIAVASPVFKWFSNNKGDEKKTTKCQDDDDERYGPTAGPTDEKTVMICTINTVYTSKYILYSIGGQDKENERLRSA